MLAVVLAGIGFGAIVAGAIHRNTARMDHLLPVLLLLAAIATLLCYLFFPENLAQSRTGVFDLSWRAVALVCIALMFPVAFLSGILFPSLVAKVQGSMGDRMNSTEITTLFNTERSEIGGQNFARRALECGGLAPLCPRNSRDSRPKKDSRCCACVTRGHKIGIPNCPFVGLPARKKNLKKSQKKLASPWPLPLNGKFERQTALFGRSKKV